MQIQTEQPKNGVDEHILVCLSSSPSNARIIHTAAKMAKVLHAKFTAIYVQTDSLESEKNRLRLEQNIQLAQGLGAEIVCNTAPAPFAFRCRNTFVAGYWRDRSVTCRMHGDRFFVRSSRFPRYKYRYGLHSRRTDGLRFDQRIPLQYSRLAFKCCIVRIFPYRTTAIIQNLC